MLNDSYDIGVYLDDGTSFGTLCRVLGELPCMWENAPWPSQFFREPEEVYGRCNAICIVDISAWWHVPFITPPLCTKQCSKIKTQFSNRFLKICSEVRVIFKNIFKVFLGFSYRVFWGIQITGLKLFLCT